MTHVSTGRGLTLGVCLLLAHAGTSFGQGFDSGFNSGSDGSDGDVTISTGTVFDPAALGLDPDGDGVYHFGTLTISAPNLRFLASTLGQGRPVVFLAQGPVTISGVLNLDGSGGHISGQLPTPADAGAGGFFGGPGGTALGSAARAGSGPGGGAAGPGLVGGGAGHVAPGTTAASNGASGGGAYGNVFLLPALGGSGGGGGGEVSGTNGGGGGGGGGSIVIASSVSISVTGTIRAIGGNGGGAAGGRNGGAGSGGSIRLIAPSISGNGSLFVSGGGGAVPGAAGRIRLESFDLSTSLFLTPTTSATKAGPGPVFPPANAPRVRVTAVGGVPVAATPTGSFVTPDVVIDSATPVSIDIAAENIPPGTQVRLTLVPDDGASIVLTSEALTGTLISPACRRVTRRAPDPPTLARRVRMGTGMRLVSGPQRPEVGGADAAPSTTRGAAHSRGDLPHETRPRTHPPEARPRPTPRS